MRRRGTRSQLAEAKAGNAFVDAMYGQGKPPQVTYPEKRKRAPPNRLVICEVCKFIRPRHDYGCPRWMDEK